MAIRAVSTMLGVALAEAPCFFGTGARLAPNIVRATFLTLAALTAPYMWLERRIRSIVRN